MKHRAAPRLSLLFLGLWAGLSAGCRSQSSGPVWDVAAVADVSIDVARQKLGQPQSEAMPSPNLAQSTWQNGDVTLSATWKPGNRRVTGWILTSRDAEHAVREDSREGLLAPGQLKDGETRYSIEWIEAPDRPLFYTGVRVIPAVKNHAVELRVSGSSALLDVTYSLSGAQGKSENFMTVAPWNSTFTLPDDTQINFSARVFKKLSPGDFQMKVEIISDGKVVSHAESSDSFVQCQSEL